MKNKVITIVGLVIMITMFVLLGYVISSNYINKNMSDQKTNLSENNEEIDKVQENNAEIDTEDKKEYENVVLNSKIGNKVLENFCISNIYSNAVYEKLDSQQFTDDSKLIYTYATIVSNYDYHNMIQSSDDKGSYISKSDFETVYKKLFGKNSKIVHKSVISDTLYHEDEQYYEYLTFGYGGVEINFILEIPYEIREYDDRIEALFYRVYAKADSTMNEDGTQNQIVKLYENSSRTKAVYESDDVKLQQNDSQQDFVKELIDSGKLNKENLETVTYTLNEENDDYYIVDVKK